MRISDWSSDVCSSDLPRWHILVVYGAPQLAIECAAQRGHEPEETDETKLAEEQQRHAPGASTRAAEPVPARRSEERRVGKEWVSTCRSRWPPDHYKNKERQDLWHASRITTNVY